MKTLLKVLRVVLVWLFNLPLLVLGVYGILLISSLLFWAMLSGLMPLHFLVAIVVLMVVSILCIFYGIRRFRTRPLQLIQLFYGVQAPLFILGLYPLYLLREVRLFQLPELAPTSLLVVSTVAVCILAFFLETLMGYAAQHRWLAWASFSHEDLKVFSVLVPDGEKFDFERLSGMLAYVLYTLQKHQFIVNVLETERTLPKDNEIRTIVKSFQNENSYLIENLKQQSQIILSRVVEEHVSSMTFQVSE